eukprot:CAMPEP_0205909778 /NCGR_PEP_ID=MMETSP1325-20131115/4082_1 /ASSEMBLY_ACC=CAM_ASM_000708 /TAXON_ID=236786 /ORGANISM="Florenciella sp., Strain RCC1007" /LENGTH=423 /DNA_ID=CAMNT_0053276099 /DNA_START=23 /DNA_END=1294 /DNA_ORIENTATION=-
MSARGELHVDSSRTVQSASFGHDMLDQFQLAPGYTNLNHGSYGATPKSVGAAQEQWRTEVEQNPDKFFRYTMWGYIDQARQDVAAYIGADSEDVVFVDNASEGMNALLKSLVVDGSTTVLYLDMAYFMVAETLRFLRDTVGVELIEVKTEDLLPTTSTRDFNTELVRRVTEALASSDRPTAVCSFSHITSVPAVILPLAELAAACKAAGAVVVGDGAHVMGQIMVDVPSLGVDVYVSNGHKWLFSPKGSAFLWVSKQYQGTESPYAADGSAVYPLVTSFEGQGESDFAKLFSYEGTKDYGAFLSFSAAIDWRSQLGEAAVIDYIHDLAVSGAELLVSKWSSRSLTPPEMIGAMLNVELPAACGTNQTFIGKLPTMLLDQYNTWVPFYVWSSRSWARVSAQVYNDLSDFAMLADAVLALCGGAD